MPHRLHALWLSVLLAFTAACSTIPPTPPTATNGKPPLRIGVTPNYAPIIYKANGQVTGLEADLAHVVAKQLERQPVFVNLKWGDLIPALTAGRIDVIMSGMSVTPGRAAQVQFTEPYMASGQMLLVRSSEVARHMVLRALPLSTERIGVEKGTTGDIFVQQHCTIARRQPFRSIEQAVAALKDNRVDVVLHDAPAILQQAILHEADGLSPIPGAVTSEALAWAVRRDDAPLAKALNDVLANLHRDGTLNALREQWIPLYRTYWRTDAL